MNNWLSSPERHFGGMFHSWEWWAITRTHKYNLYFYKQSLMLEQHNALQHTKQTYSTVHCMCIFIHEQNLNWRNYTRTHNATNAALLPYPKPICVASNLKACLILTTPTMSVLLSHLVGVECTRHKVNSKWRPNEWATKDRSTSLNSRALNDRIILVSECNDLFEGHQLFVTNSTTLIESNTTQVYFYFSLLPLHVCEMFRPVLRPSSGMSIQNLTKRKIR